MGSAHNWVQCRAFGCGEGKVGLCWMIKNMFYVESNCFNWFWSNSSHFKFAYNLQTFLNQFLNFERPLVILKHYCGLKSKDQRINVKFKHFTSSYQSIFGPVHHYKQFKIIHTETKWLKNHQCAMWILIFF